MKKAIESFNDEFNELSKHLDFIENLEIEIKNTNPLYTYVSSKSKKKYDYNSIVISLYGLIERNIEKFIIAYLSEIEDNILVYSRLNRKLSDSHFNLTNNLLTKILLGQHQKYTNLNKEKIIKNLAECLNSDNSYILNKEAFTINSGNLKHKKICELFHNLDINLDSSIRKNKEFNFKSENLFNKLDSLVDRRNELSHGSISSIMDSSEFRPVMDFIKKYITEVFNILEIKLENEINSFKKKAYGIPVENVRKFKGKIIGIEDGAKFNLRINEEVLLEKKNGEIRTAIIQEINNHENFDVTIKLDKYHYKNEKLYLVNQGGYKIHSAYRRRIINKF